MIKVNKSFSIKRYPYGWELHTHTPRTEDQKFGGHTIKAGTLSTRITFHDTFKQIAERIVDAQITECDDLEEVLATLKETENIVVERLERNDRHKVV